MDVGKRIQRLRTEKGLTQEQFAKRLFVSRTAVSKWETGRGTPNIESLKMIAKEFGITLDDLLCAQEAIEACENEHREKESKTDAILNACACLALFLPIYKTESAGEFVSVPLYAFDGRFSALFWVFPALMIVCGALQWILKNGKIPRAAGFVINTCAVILFILTGQPYPAVLYFVFLLLKTAVSGKIFLTRKESRM